MNKGEVLIEVDILLSAEVVVFYITHEVVVFYITLEVVSRYPVSQLQVG